LLQTPASSLPKISDQSYELNQKSPLAISPQLFHSKLKVLLLNKSYPDSSSSPHLSPSQLQTPSTIAACLPAWLSGYWPAAYRCLCWSKRLWMSWFPRPRFCGRSRNLEFTITITALFTIQRIRGRLNRIWSLSNVFWRHYRIAKSEEQYDLPNYSCNANNDDENVRNSNFYEIIPDSSLGFDRDSGHCSTRDSANAECSEKENDYLTPVIENEYLSIV